MEALNSSGGGTGPNAWTTYKEYNKDFTVDYAKGTITMNQYFFNEAADDIITLKFYLQSGQILQYKIKKSGSKVTTYYAKPSLKHKTLTLPVGKTAKIAIKNLTKTASVTYSSSNKSTATVSKAGVITAQNAGTAKITVTIKQNSTTYKLTMTVKVKK